MDRIEHYKNSISREELLRQADEAMADIHANLDANLGLGEAEVAEVVDSFIKRRLGIRDYESWRKRFPKLRAKQRNPAHWGLSPSPITEFLVRSEDDNMLFDGGAVENLALYASAFDCDVTFVTSDLLMAQGFDNRVAMESLSTRASAICVQESWFPLFAAPLDVAVVSGERALPSLKARLKEIVEVSAPVATHMIVGGDTGNALHQSFLRRLYSGWIKVPIASDAALYSRGSEAQAEAADRLA
jgi:hypothetical protein